MNELKHLVEFRQIVNNYRISDDSQKILKDTKLVLLLAPTSTGRNTIIRELIKNGKYHYIISDTTRHPRINDGIREKDGVEYWFRSEDDVLMDLKNGAFLEAELIHGQQISGISIRELKKAHDEHKIAITDVDLKGVQNIVKVKPDTLAIMVLPPSFSEWQRRIKKRGVMAKVEYTRRLETARRIFQAGLEEKTIKFVINDQLSDAVKQVNQLVGPSAWNQQGQAKALKLVKDLYYKINDPQKTDDI